VRRTAIRETLLFWRSHEEPGRAGEASATDVGVLRALAGVVFEGVAVVEEGGRISEANEVFASIFGYELPGVVGRTLEEFVIPEFRGLVEKSLSAGFGETYEVVALKRDGTPLNVEIRSRPSSYGGRVVHLVAVRDITGDNGVEGRLGQAGYRALVEQIPAVTYTQEPKAGHHFASLYLSPQAERMLGYALEEFASDPGLWVRLIHPDDRERVLAEDARTDETGEQFSAEYRLLTRDGRMVWVRDEATLVSDEDGRPLCWQGVLTDVTDRKQAEEALKESEHRYTDLLSSTRAFVYRCLNEAGWPDEFASAYALELTGYTPEELMVGGTMRFGDLIVEEDRQRVWDEVQTALQRRERFKIRYAIRSKDGTLRHVEEYGQGVYDQEDNVEAIEGIVYDVTELKRAEQRLREVEERYRTLAEEIPAVTYIKAVDHSSQSSYVSPQMEALLGYKPEEWTSDPDQWIKIMHPADRERVLAEVARTDETGEPFRMEFRQFAKDGRVVWIRDEAVLVRDEEGNPSYWLGIQYDITKRKHSEEAREESELRLRTVISNVPVVLFAINFAGVISLSEGRGMGALGLEPGEVVGRSISEVFGGVPGILEDVDRALAGETLSSVREVNSRTFEMWYSPVRANTGEVTGVTGVSIDITDRKEAEEALRQSEERYRLVARATNEAIWDNDLTTGRQSWNGAVEPMFGYSPDEIGDQGSWWEERLHPDDRERVLSAVEGVLQEEGGEEWSNEYRFRRADGTYATVVDRAYILRDEGGRAVRLVGSMMDVTERRRAEEQVRSSEAELRALFSAMKDVILVLDSEGRYLRVAPTNPSLLYRPSEEMLGKTLHEVFPPEQADAFLDSVRRALDSGEPVETEYSLWIADKEIWFAGTVSPLQEDQVLYIARDITERKRAEEELRRSEAGLAEAQRIAHLGNWEWDLVADEVYWSDEVFRIYGYEPKAFVPTLERLFEVVRPDDRERLRAAIDGAIYRDEPYDFEHLIVRPDGEERVVHRRAEVVRDEDGKPIKMIGTVHDITERKRAEEELKESAGRFRSTFENAPIGMALVSLDNHYRQVNQAFCDMLGYSQEELLSRRTFEITHPDDLEASIARTQALLEGTTDRDLLEKRYICADGQVVWALSSVSLVRDSRGDPAHFVSQYQNITERKKAEEDMKEANRRLEELAVLKADFTAMVAHELDTPLAVIRGYADMLATGELDIDEQALALDRVQAETDLLEALVSDVRSAAAVERGDFAIELQQVALDGLLRDAAAFVETLHGDHRLVTQGATDGWVLADPHRIRQVLRNLLSNAAKYSPDGTPIELRTAPGATPGRVRIEVADRGPGIHPDDAARIFEKFGRGRDGGGRKVAGTGLGLYLSKRILQAHGSELTLDTEPGGGSVFGFELRAGR
jgi:PAS domain S-box-containing protein